MGSISMPQGRGNRMHNIRGYGEGRMPGNVDVAKTGENITVADETLSHAYHRLFDEEVRAYNAKQKRADRQIADYYQHIKNSKNGEKLFYEDVLQWGKKEDFEQHPELREVAKECLLVYILGSEEDGIRPFTERNPGLELIGAYIHMDEASPHLHFDYIPVAIGYKSGMQKRNSLDRAMKALIRERTGSEYSPRAGEKDAAGKCIDNATKQWKEMERAIFRRICLARGLQVEEEIRTPERDSLSVLEYKSKVRREELVSLEERAEGLKGEILTAAQVYDIDVNRPLIGQRVKVAYTEFVSLKKTAEHIDEVVAEARQKMDRAEELRAEAEAIITQRDSIIGAAMERAQKIIKDAMESATAKAKETLSTLKSKIKSLTAEKKYLEEEVAAKSREGDAILDQKKKTADRLVLDAQVRAEEIVDRAIKDAGAEHIAEEINRRLGIIPMKELADAKRKVQASYEKFCEFDTDGTVARSIEEDRMDGIDKWYQSAIVFNRDGTVREWKPWHDAIMELHTDMQKYLSIKQKPHSVDEVMEAIRVTLPTQPRGRKK